MSNTTVTEIDFYPLQTKKVQEYWNPDNCSLCGKKLGRHPKQVHYLTNGNITTATETEVIMEADNSQGFWGIGNECAKKLPAAFIFNYDGTK